MKFKLLQGSHVQNEEGIPVVYYARDPQRNIVESSSNLEHRFGPQKFQLLDGMTLAADSALQQQIISQQREIERLQALVQSSSATAVAEEEPEENFDLDHLSVKELRALADKEGIDLGTASHKAEIMSVIRSALDAQ